ncbi:transmembrane protein 270 [Echinops telfairi]|uniref:Transmembrane protein 270 n=1 Tax=Echinops telfairi TaxID=9371 RepID=A0AC55CMM1_ECHTE|nr:transmembrane protein 270 [Echinops telfairi]
MEGGFRQQPRLTGGPRRGELVQNRSHLYNFLLFKIVLFNHWVTGLSQEAKGSGCRQSCLPPVTACRVGQALRAGLALIATPVWLALWVPRLVWGSVLGCVRVMGLHPRKWLGLPTATWTNLLVSCLHSLMLVALLLLLLAWRLGRVLHRFSLGQLSSQALLENRVALSLGALFKRLSWRVQSVALLTSWRLAYLVTWATCLASHLLQAAFEHTVQLAQEAELQEASGPLLEARCPKPLTLEAGPTLPELEIPGE